MNKNEEKRKRTDKCMYGNWHATGTSKENEVTINLEFALEVGKKETKFIVKKNGNTVKNETFSTSGIIWVNEYLWYSDTKKYFITSADEKHIAFGELSTPGNFNGQYELYIKLDRV